MIQKTQLHQLKKKAKLLDPALRIGKNGITESFIEHLTLMLIKKKLVKVKLLRSASEQLDRKEVALGLAEKTGSILIDNTGMTLVLYRR